MEKVCGARGGIMGVERVYLRCVEEVKEKLAVGADSNVLNPSFVGEFVDGANCRL